MARKNKQQLIDEYKALTDSEPNSEWTNAEIEDAIALVKAGLDVDESEEDIVLEDPEGAEAPEGAEDPEGAEAPEGAEDPEGAEGYRVCKGQTVTARGKIYQGNNNDIVPQEDISDPELFKKLGIIE